MQNGSLHLIFYVTINRLQELHWGLIREAGETKAGNAWDGIDAGFFYTGGYRVVSGQQLTR